jgi:hypothetical protein
MQSEFIVLDKVGDEDKWIHNFLEDISCYPKPMSVICVHCDYQSTIKRA